MASAYQVDPNGKGYQHFKFLWEALLTKEKALAELTSQTNLAVQQWKGDRTGIEFMMKNLRDERTALKKYKTELNLWFLSHQTAETKEQDVFDKLISCLENLISAYPDTSYATIANEVLRAFQKETLDEAARKILREKFRTLGIALNNTGPDASSSPEVVSLGESSVDTFTEIP